MPNRGTILIADDSRDDVFFVKRAFTKAGFNAHVREVKDGQEAVDYLAGEDEYADRSAYPLPCLLLLDLKMPKLNGFDVLGWLQKQPQLKCLPVTVLTSSNVNSDVDRAYELGANSYVVKPSSAEGFEEMAAQIHSYWMEVNRPPSAMLPE